jgi:hypothetical protein
MHPGWDGFPPPLYGVRLHRTGVGGWSRGPRLSAPSRDIVREAGHERIDEILAKRTQQWAAEAGEHMRKITLALAATASLAFAPAALGQATTTTDTSMTAAPATTPVEDDDNDFPWGLLGLIGLAGLLGRKRDDRVHTDTNRRT